jgi:hypothetical protein
LDRRQAWRAFVKSATTIYEVCLFSFTLACIFLHQGHSVIPKHT